MKRIKRIVKDPTVSFSLEYFNRMMNFIIKVVDSSLLEGKGERDGKVRREFGGWDGLGKG